MKKRYWHFIGSDRKLANGDSRLVEAGQTYTIDCRPSLCELGLHASKNPLDALNYAPGMIVCRVELGGNIIHSDDKSVATERKVLWIADAEDVLNEFGRWCALQVIGLWDAPDVVVEYLKTGNESLREESSQLSASASARARASASAWASARASASASAWASARARARAR